jgi:hypothetical protein
MNKIFRIRFSECRSDNRKSKIKNPKWVEQFALVLTFAMCGVVAQAQQPKRVARVGYLSVLSPISDSARLEAFRRGLREAGLR